MLPEPNRFDAHFAQGNINLDISGDVTLDFGGPKPFIGFRRPVAFGAFVPKASIDENRHFFGAKIKVGFSWELFMDPVSANPLRP